jgi:hypothetical protein
MKSLAIEHLKYELERINYQLEDLNSDSPKLLVKLGFQEPIGILDRKEKVFFLDIKKQQFEEAIKILEDKLKT